MVTRRESPRRIALAAALGMAVGVLLGFALAQFVPSPSAQPANAAVANLPAKAPAATNAGAAIPVAATSTLTQPPKLQPLPAPVTTVAPVREPAVTSRMAAGRELLADASSAPRFAVQLLVADAKERGYLENYLSEAGRALQPERLFVVPAGSPAAPRLGVLFGSFDELGAANVALAALPENLKQFRPYVRSLDGVREDVRRAENR